MHRKQNYIFLFLFLVSVIAVLLAIRHMVSTMDPKYAGLIFASIIVPFSIWNAWLYISEGRYQPTIGGNLISGFAKGFTKKALRIYSGLALALNY